MSIEAIRLYLDTLLGHCKFLSAPGDYVGDLTTKLLQLDQIARELHAPAIAATDDVPDHLKTRWVSMLDEIMDAHGLLIMAVGMPLPDKRLQREYGLLCPLVRESAEGVEFAGCKIF